MIEYYQANGTVIILHQTLVIYLDVLLFVNVVVNFTILYLTYKILGMKISKPRIIFATALTSLYGLVVCLPQMSVLLNIFFKAAIAVITVLTAFDFRGIKIFLKSIAVFLAVTFSYIGIVTSFQYLPFASSAIFVQNGEVYYNLPLPYILIATVALFLVEKLISRHFSRKLGKGDTVSCKIVLRGEEKEITAFCDSGNFLREPLSGLPVVIVNPRAVGRLLPENANKQSGNELFSILEQDEFFKLRLRVIPFRGAKNSGGMLVGIKPDAFFAAGEEKEVILALDDCFFKDGKEYDAILNL